MQGIELRLTTRKANALPIVLLLCPHNFNFIANHHLITLGTSSGSGVTFRFGEVSYRSQALEAIWFSTILVSRGTLCFPLLWWSEKTPKAAPFCLSELSSCWLFPPATLLGHSHIILWLLSPPGFCLFALLVNYALYKMYPFNHCSVALRIISLLWPSSLLISRTLVASQNQALCHETLTPRSSILPSLAITSLLWLCKWTQYLKEVGMDHIWFYCCCLWLA